MTGASIPGVSFAKRVFTAAAIYGFLVLLPQYFMEDRVGRDFPPPLTHPEYFYGFIGVAVAWQMLFVIIAHDPVRYRAAMLAAILEKITWGGATIALYLQGRLAAMVLAAGIADLVLAGLFALSFFATRERTERDGASR